MALIKDSYVDALDDHAASYLPAIIGETTTLKKQGKDLVGLCVFHDEKTPSLSVNANNGKFHCFGCGAGGHTALSFIIDYYQLPFPDAVRRLATITGYRAPEYEQSNDNQSPKINTQLPKKALSLASQLYVTQLMNTSSVISHLQSRGLTKEDIDRFQIGFAPDDYDFIPKHLIPKVGRKSLVNAGLLASKPESKRVWDFFRFRVMFPVRNISGQIIAFGGRTLLQDKDKRKKVGKYINSPDTPLFTKGQHLYGLYESSLQKNPEDGIINIVEGYMDVIASHRHRFSNTVAPMGTATSEGQLSTLFRHADHLRLVFDGDNAGYQAAVKAINTALPLIDGCKTLSIVLLPENEDPDSYLVNHGAEAYSKQLDRAIPASKFIADHLKRLCPGKHPESQAKLVHQVQHYIQKVSEPTFQTLLKIELEHQLQLPQGMKWFDHANDPSLLWSQIGDSEKNLINKASSDVVKYCGLVLKAPQWIDMFPFDANEKEEEANAELIQFTQYTLSIAKSHGTPTADVYDSGLRNLVNYLQSLPGENLSDHINIAKNFGLNSQEDLDKKKDVHLTLAAN